MARRKTTFLDDLMELASHLPWWVGALLAIGSYVFLHQFAAIDLHQHGGRPGNVLGSTIIKIMATVFQYLIPLALGFGAVLSGIKQWQRKGIFRKQTSLQTIRELDWKKFELLIGQAFREKGYQVKETVDGPDGGVDLVLEKEGRKTLVQCKHWKKMKVGVKEVRELNGIVAVKGAYGGILVTSGRFTREAMDFAKACYIDLIDGEKLNRLIPHINSSEQNYTPEQTIPNCPKCGGKMLLKIAKRGPNPGSRFWGCSTYPRCKGTLNISETSQEY